MPARAKAGRRKYKPSFTYIGEISPANEEQAQIKSLVIEIFSTGLDGTALTESIRNELDGQLMVSITVQSRPFRFHKILFSLETRCFTFPDVCEAIHIGSMVSQRLIACIWHRAEDADLRVGLCKLCSDIRASFMQRNNDILSQFQSEAGGPSSDTTPRPLQVEIDVLARTMRSLQEEDVNTGTNEDEFDYDRAAVTHNQTSAPYQPVSPALDQDTAVSVNPIKDELSGDVPYPPPLPLTGHPPSPVFHPLAKNTPKVASVQRTDQHSDPQPAAPYPLLRAVHVVQTLGLGSTQTKPKPNALGARVSFPE